MYSLVLSVIPSNIIISVIAPFSPPVAIEPAAFAGIVCDSFVRKPVTASVPSVPAVPVEPCAPSDPSEPPCTLNIVVVSDSESLETATVNGKSDLLKDENANANVLVPVPLLTDPPNDGVVNVLPPALVIVISLVAIVPLKFCWFTVKLIDVGVAELSSELSNA